MLTTGRKELIVYVKNINGTTDADCACGGWLEHWKKFSGQPLPIFCPEESCIREPEMGAHVQKYDSPDAGWYIVPLCRMHNGETGKSLTISDSVNLVSANVESTCGKKG
jgi:hypothetical protein